MRDQPLSEGAFGEFNILLANGLHDLKRQQTTQTLLSAAFGRQSSSDRGCFQQPVLDQPPLPYLRVQRQRTGRTGRAQNTGRGVSIGRATTQSIVNVCAVGHQAMRPVVST